MRFLQIMFLLVVISSCSKKKKTTETTNIKARWITEAFQAIDNGEFPRIRAVSWWQEKWENEDGSISDLRINSSQESLDAFTSSIQDSFFQTTPQFSNDKLIPPIQGVYFAAFPDFGGPEDQVSAQRIMDFENLAQKQITWAYFSDNWYQNIRFPVANVQSIHNAGRVPFIRMMARSSLAESQADPIYHLQNIIDGDFDTQLLQWFQEAAQINYPLLIEFGTEVNGDWFPWNGIYNGASEKTGYGDPNLPDGPERFRDAYRHIIDLSRQASANNITWFFHIDAYGQPEDTWNDFENYYPGDAYIDWIGVSVYGAVTPNDEYETFRHKLNRVYNRLINMTQKPLAVLELGIVEEVNNP